MLVRLSRKHLQQVLNLTKPRMTLSKERCLLSFILLTMLVLIALYVDDSFIRPFAGDVLVVMFLYCVITSVLSGVKLIAGVGVLSLACLVEWGQYLQILEYLAWQEHHVLRLVLGATYDPLDLFAYVLGVALCLAVEYELNGYQRKWV